MKKKETRESIPVLTLFHSIHSELIHMIIMSMKVAEEFSFVYISSASNQGKGNIVRKKVINI